MSRRAAASSSTPGGVSSIGRIVNRKVSGPTVMTTSSSGSLRMTTSSCGRPVRVGSRFAGASGSVDIDVSTRQRVSRQRGLGQHLPGNVIPPHEIPAVQCTLAARVHRELDGGHRAPGEDHPVIAAGREQLHRDTQARGLLDESVTELRVRELPERHLALLEAPRRPRSTGHVRLDQVGFFGRARRKVRDELVCRPAPTGREPSCRRYEQGCDEFADLVDVLFGFRHDASIPADTRTFPDGLSDRARTRVMGRRGPTHHNPDQVQPLAVPAAVTVTTPLLAPRL